MKDNLLTAKLLENEAKLRYGNIVTQYPRPFSWPFAASVRKSYGKEIAPFNLRIKEKKRYFPSSLAAILFLVCGRSYFSLLIYIYLFQIQH